MTAKEIIELVADEWGVDVRSLVGPGRKHQFARVRQLAAYILHEHQLSLAAIGRLLGGRDHSTVIHSLKMARRRFAEDPELAARVSAIVVRTTNGRVLLEQEAPPAPRAKLAGTELEILEGVGHVPKAAWVLNNRASFHISGLSGVR